MINYAEQESVQTRSRRFSLLSFSFSFFFVTSDLDPHLGILTFDPLSKALPFDLSLVALKVPQPGADRRGEGDKRGPGSH